jgi:hypothetical protein
LNATDPGAGDKPAAAQKKALDQVIDRELLAAQAIESKMDRDPAVMLEIERSRSQILAEAYLQSRIAQAAKPTRAEIDDYIQHHPELFSNRKLYSLRYLAIPSTVLNDELSASAERAASLDELAGTLKTRRIAFSEAQAYRSSRRGGAAGRAVPDGPQGTRHVEGRSHAAAPPRQHRVSGWRRRRRAAGKGGGARTGSRTGQCESGNRKRHERAALSGPGGTP